ncbi:hypothetical protein SOCEGT47_074690 [Sorangium cellulosum]|uniref:Sulfotransferase family protein n=1 Tax=Sorangium cellulosum TaxID=56 RepID=A0A4P2QBC8_SORCE|nr:sulfotransferase family protein [Sorangium cellulosum]AUX26899.1 hypothetical protein SOCEGT47_074690 [Sorangium cellulosum]
MNTITVVSGLPRSGTSMTMRMLGAGGAPVLTDGLRAPDEDNLRGYFEFEPVKQKDRSWIPTARGKAVKMVYRLLYELPPDERYDVIFVRRRMSEILASQKKMLSRSGSRVTPLSDEQLAAIYEDEVKSALIWARAQPNFRLIEVSYNAVLSAPLEEAARIAAFLERPLDVEAMARAVDADLYRNRHAPDPTSP